MNSLDGRRKAWEGHNIGDGTSEITNHQSLFNSTSDAFD